MDINGFIPEEAEIEASPRSFNDGVKNFADVDDSVESKQFLDNVIATIDGYNDHFITQREPWAKDDDGIWAMQDSAWRCFLNEDALDSENQFGADVPDNWNRANVGSTTFRRQVSQMASNGYSVQTQRDVPFKFSALSDNEIDEPDHVKSREKRQNLTAKWTMKADNMNQKTIEFWTQVEKNGNIPVSVEWNRTYKTKKIAKPTFDDEGSPSGFEFETIDVIDNNYPKFRTLPVNSVSADTKIGCIQDQECVIVTTVNGLTDIVQRITDGQYRDNLLSDLDRTYQWDGYSGKENEDTKRKNRGIEEDDSNGIYNSGYLVRESFVNLPIDEETGEWDELKVIPKRYRVTLIGNSPRESLVARIERNQEPDDTIPIEMIHAIPDDSDCLYHSSPYEAIRGNIAAETTIKNQAIDNNTLTNKPPIKRVRGSMDGSDVSFGPDAVFDVNHKDDVTQMDVRSLDQTNILLLEHLYDDSNRTNNIDPNMAGESLGARTSSQEAGNIAAHSRRPNLVHIEYVLNQLFGFYAKRLQVLWPVYGDPNQVLQITDENNDTVYVKPTEITGDFDIVIDLVDEIKDDAVASQRMLSYMQTVSAIPELSQRQDWDDLANLYAEKSLGTTAVIIQGNDGDADLMAKMNLKMILEDGEVPEMNQTMNLKKHLEVYKDELIRWAGSEEQNPNIELLRQIIETIEARMQTPSQQGQAQAQPQEIAAPTNALEQGQAESGAIGGLQ